MTFIGIDPGKSGYIAAINEDGSVETEPFSESGYAGFISRHGNAFAVVERVHSSPQMGVSSSFSFGQNFGIIQGLLIANAVPYELVLPQKWKKFFGATADKNTSISIAQRLFPTVDLRATPRCKKAHDGKAEAILMALYAKRIHHGE